MIGTISTSTLDGYKVAMGKGNYTVSGGNMLLQHNLNTTDIAMHVTYEDTTTNAGTGLIFISQGSTDANTMRFHVHDSNNSVWTGTCKGIWLAVYK